MREKVQARTPGRGNTRMIERSRSMAELNHIQQHVIVDATPEECYAVAVGFEDYPNWAGSMRRVTILKRNSAGLGEEVEWVMGIFGITSLNVMRYKHQKPHSVEWMTITESKGIKELHGRYEFVPVRKDDQQPQTKVIYRLRVEPNFPFPKMVKKGTNKAVAKMALRDLKRYTEKLRKRRLRAETGVDEESAGSLSLRSLFSCACFPLKQLWLIEHKIWKMGWWQLWTTFCGCFA